MSAQEPFLIELMRRNPTGDIRHSPDGEGALGTHAGSFLVALDEYIRQVKAEAWDSGALAGLMDALAAARDPEAPPVVNPYLAAPPH